MRGLRTFDFYSIYFLERKNNLVGVCSVFYKPQKSVRTVFVSCELTKP